MKDKRVAIIGYALDNYSGESMLSSEEIGFYVAKRAREAAGVARDDIDSVHNSTMDFFDGITISNGILLPAAGGYGRDGTRIQNGGVFAIISAYASILSGASEVAVVSSADSVIYNMEKIANVSYDVFFNQPVGLNHLLTYALFSAAYMHEYGVTDEDVAMVAAQNYRAGAQNAYAHLKDSCSTDDILKSPMISGPLRAREIALHSSYGGAALVLASEEKAKKYTDAPVWITGIGMGTSSVNIEEVIQLSALRLAAKKAFAMAGIDEPRQEIDVAEVSSPFALYELAAYSALGFCAPEEAAELVHQGVTSLEGELPVNPSGGTLCTNAPNSNGLFKTVQTLMYLQNGKGGHAKRAIVHDSDMSIGLIGDSHAVIILEKEV